MKKLILAIIALTAIAVAARVIKKLNEYKHFKNEYIQLKKLKFRNQPL